MSCVDINDDDVFVFSENAGQSNTAIDWARIAIAPSAGAVIVGTGLAASSSASAGFANIVAEASHTQSESGVLSGTSGNDTLVVTTSTTEVIGNGGKDVAVFEDVSDSAFSWYKIDATPDGGLDVQDAHSTGQTVHVLGVQTLEFNDGLYDTSTGVFTPTSISSPTSNSSTSHQILAPLPPQAANGRDIVGVVLQNNSNVSQAGGVVTFGEVFAKGAVKPGQELVAKIGGHDFAVQMDVKSTNADGSVRQAILTLQAPSIAANSDASVMLTKAGRAISTATAITANDVANSGYDLQVKVAVHNADGSTTTKTVDAASLLKTAIASGHVQTWLHGPLAGEYDVTAKIASNLSVTFDIREDANGETHTNLTFARDQAYTKDVSTLDYDVSIVQDGKTAYNQNHIQQYAFSTWSKEIDSSGVISPHVVYDMQYLMKTGAIPAYDLNAGVASSSINSESQALSAAGTGPLGTGTITTYMPGTGGRPDIGAEPTWVVDYLASQSAGAQRVMFANANMAGGIPWHVMDGSQPVSVYKHGELWVDPRGEGSIYGSDALPVTFSQASGPWTLDTAHQPDLSYLPYLLTGSQEYLSDLKAQAAYVIASYNPDYRGATNDLVPDGSQVRAKAWDIRDIANAAYALPDSDPMKAYFRQVLNHNLQHLINTFVNGSQGAAEGQLAGWIGGDYGSVPGVMAPWQQDYFAIVMEQLIEQGFTKAETILKWEDSFLSGRFLNGANGFNPNEGLAYNLQVGDSTTGHTYKTWQDVYAASFGSDQPNALQGDATSSGGYGANARAGLASDISGTQSPLAVEAYAWLVSQTPDITKAFGTDPTWDIVPRLSNGEYLTNDKIQAATKKSGETLTAGKHDSLLIGGAGNDTLVGNKGVDILLAGTGHQTLRGASGNDYIFAGKGGDIITGGKGADYMTAGAGHDTFIFGGASASMGAHYDTIVGFDFAHDAFNFPGQIAAIDPALTEGHLSATTFGEDLRHAVTAGHLGAHDAMLFTASSGALAGETFLIVDLNGKAGYQPRADLVVHLLDASGSLTHADFI